jgi:hypothetical protein
MIIDEPEREVDGWDEAEAALTAAQQMPGGPERMTRSGKPDSLDSGPMSAARQSEIRNPRQNYK